MKFNHEFLLFRYLFQVYAFSKGMVGGFVIADRNRLLGNPFGCSYCVLNESEHTQWLIVGDRWLKTDLIMSGYSTFELEPYTFMRFL